MILTYRLTPLSRSKIIGHTRGWRLSGSLQRNPLVEFCGRVSWNLLLVCTHLKSLKKARTKGKESRVYYLLCDEMIVFILD